MPVSVGQKAPDFTLVDVDRNPKSLKDFAGKKTVLVFYPGAFTGVCTKEMCTFRDSLSALNDLSAQVVGISVDAPAANKAFGDANKLTFPLLSDYERKAVTAYDIPQIDFAGLKGLTTAKRSVFVLDADGTIQFAWVSDNPAVEPDYDAVKKAVASI